MSEALSVVLEAVRDGEVTVEEALRRLAAWPIEDLGFAQLDHHRGLRGGFPEVVYGPGKTADEVAQALERLADVHGVALATRLTPEQAAAAVEAVPGAVHHERGRIVAVRRKAPPPPAHARVCVVAAGTSDLPVAEEAAVTAELAGARVTRLVDVGVAGIHRLLARMEDLAEARAIVAVAGMEGALPGVVAGLVAAPVVAVPTSVGYGAHLGGVAPLLTMLNACAPGVAVVNIDNGFGGGYLAAMIALGPPGARIEAAP